MSKTRIYHGSLEQVPTPQIRKSNRSLDYGYGFYTTTNLEQATDWVYRHKKDKNKPVCGYVNIYEIDLDVVRSGHCLWFDEATEKWVDFVYANRNDRLFCHDYDFVYGPVANDRVYAAFALYEAGLINKQELIAELKTYKLIDQLLFHTPTSLQSISFIQSIEIPL